MFLRTARRGPISPAWATLALGLALAPPLGAQEAAAVGGVVVDADSGDPVTGVEVRVDGDLATVTDAEGGFRLARVPRGRRILTFRHVAYGEHEQVLVLEGDAELQYHVRMSREAIELSPLRVEVESSASSYADEVFRGGGNPANIIDAATIGAADRMGLTFMSLLRREVPGIQFRGNDCIEYRARGFDVFVPGEVIGGDTIMVLLTDNCRDMTVYLDGVPMPESASVLFDLYLGQIEQVEVLSPAMAGVRYGAAGSRGVILVETRQGNMASGAIPDRVHVTGFGWHEERPYGWARVLGVSFATHAAGAALTFGSVLDCSDENRVFEEPSRCNTSLATGSGILAGTVGGLLTSWAGRSALTEGRKFPQLVMATAGATSSYLILKRSEPTGLDREIVTGIVLASAATAVLSTLTDRIFRVAR